ncbi:MAG: GAF domain-containing sensor histidine kinase [Pseudomonadota bacterium]
MELFEDLIGVSHDTGTTFGEGSTCQGCKDREILESGLHILNYAFSIEALYEGILSVLTKIVPFSDAAILMPTEENCLETVVNHAGKLNIQLPSPEGAFAAVLEGEAVVAGDLGEFSGWEKASSRSVGAFSSALILPLGTADEAAIIICVHKDHAAFDQEHLRKLKTFAPVAAQAVQWAKQRHAMERHRDHLEDLVSERTRELAEQKERLAQALEKELELNGLQRQFVSMVCHEFRTPLAIIDGNAQQVIRRHDKMQPERLLGSLGKVRKSVVRLTDLIESVLDAARLEAGSLKFEPQTCRFDTMIEEVCNNYRELNPNYPIIADIDELQHDMFADIKLMRQVISNLVGNAVKYSPEGTEVCVSGRMTDDGGVLISVRDNGVGIPEEELAQLFERFFRASTSVGIVGTGIGLHLVKTVVDLHGGRIDVASKPGEGSTFTIDLPGQEALPEAMAV